MATNDTSGADRTQYKICTDTHRVADQNARWMADQSYAVDHVVEAHRLRQENPELVQACQRAVADDTARTVLSVLLRRQRATYSALREAVGDVSQKTVERRVWPLRDAGVVRVTDARVAVVELASVAAEVVAAEVLAPWR